MPKPSCKSRRVYGFVLLVLVAPVVAGAQAEPPVGPEYDDFFYHYEDAGGRMSQAFAAVRGQLGLSAEPVDRSFALIAGVSRYPNMGVFERDLAPARRDVAMLKEYLRDVESFDEVVVLEDDDVTTENLEYFLQGYFLERVRQFPRSRFVFAYSGHGMTLGNRGYLLRSDAQDLTDQAHSINLRIVKALIDDISDAGHHVLVLLNSCYAGSFLGRSAFGAGATLVPQRPGAHAIVSGGSEEESWHDPLVGDGNLFFEKMIAGLGGIADTNSDGLVLADELAGYLRREIRLHTNEQQVPQFGDISRNGSAGDFFFFNRSQQVDLGVVPPWNRTASSNFGGDPGSRATGSTDGDLRGNSNTISVPADVGSDAVPVLADVVEAAEARNGGLNPFIFIDGGRFLMGSSEPISGRDNEGPQHWVDLSPFYIQKYEVTNAEYRRFRPDHTFDADKSRHPVVNVSWHEASAYATWLGGALPTEAQWEFAARGETGRPYPWGSDAPISGTHANFVEGPGETTAVGQHPAGRTPEGVHDLAGNVWEWVEDDWHYGYTGAPNDGSAWIDGSRTFGPLVTVARGGSFLHHEDLLRATVRNMTPPLPQGAIGFRVVISPFSSDYSATTAVPSVPLGGVRDAASDLARLVEAAEERNGGLNPFIFIEGGRFQMGSPEGGGDDDERPQHWVDVSSFYIQQYEVTNAEYQRFQPDHAFDREKAQHPVVSVTWDEARAYAEWLGGALPTEAQWEFAARGEEGRKYPWGSEEPIAGTYANFTDAVGDTVAVGQHPRGAIPVGVHDLFGNVWELVEDDWHDDYIDAPDDGSAWVDIPRAARRVVRGGSFSFYAGCVRAACRSYFRPDVRGNNIGFRVVVSPFSDSGL